VVLPYAIEIGSRVRRVDVRRRNDGFAVSVDGRTSHVDVVRVDGQTLSLRMDTGRVHDAVVVASPSGFSVRVGGVTVAAAVQGRGGRRSSGAREHTSASSNRVIAPMSGKIVAVLVATGEKVRAGQPVVVIEAMKMENEVRASCDGTVAEIHVATAISVDAGALLVVIQ
jgi:biotin carboxyl carrier protein